MKRVLIVDDASFMRMSIKNMLANYDFEVVVELDDKGYVIAGEDCKTESRGIFTAGDCRTKNVRQLTTAASDGAVAAIGACEYIDSELDTKNTK